MAEETSFPVAQCSCAHWSLQNVKGKLDGRAGLWKMLSGCGDGSDLFQQTRTRALRRDTDSCREAQGLSRSRTQRIKSLVP